MTLSRRLFLGAAVGACVLRPRRRPPVGIFMRGGADGLSMIVPHADSAYYGARPTTAISRREVIDLDGRCGLHPALAPLQAYWNDGRLGVVRAARMADVGSSHAPAQARVLALLAAARVQVIDTWGWDTHFHQGDSTGPLARRLQQLARRIDALARSGRTVFTISEFGRTSHENHFGGTDHAPAVAMLLVGRRLTGGIVHDQTDMHDAVRSFVAL
jgi:uncharacterized protein (DUF1501 family)